MTEAEREQFEQLVYPVMNYLKDNQHPHTHILITSDNAQLMEGLISISRDGSNFQVSESSTFENLIIATRDLLFSLKKGNLYEMVEKSGTVWEALAAAEHERVEMAQMAGELKQDTSDMMRFKKGTEVTVDFYNSQRLNGTVEAVETEEGSVFYDVRIPVGFDKDYTILKSIPSAYINVYPEQG